MDEVITCNCSSQRWIIGTSGILCGECGGYLPDEFKLDVDAANKWLQNTSPEEED